jgi:hypothetical protein
MKATDYVSIEPNTGWAYARAVMVTLGILLVLAIGLVAALRCAGFFYFAFAHRNPLHAGWWGWFDGVSACMQDCKPVEHRHLLGSAILALALIFGGPLLAWVSIRDQHERRELYGSARFASEHDIRKAGLL